MSKKGTGYNPGEALQNAYDICNWPVPLFCQYAAIVTKATRMNLELTQQAVQAFLDGQQEFLGKIPSEMFAFADWVATKGSRETVHREVHRKEGDTLVNATVQRGKRKGSSVVPFVRKAAA